MKTHVAAFSIAVSLFNVGCGLQHHFTKTQLETDTAACAYGVAVPHNYGTPDKRAHFVNDIAVPACLRAKGYNVQPKAE